MAPCASTALIIGGGIAGLSVSIALSRVGVQCEIVEKSNPNEGASIAFSGRPTDALVELGIYDLIAENGTLFPNNTSAAAMRDSMGKLISPSPPRPTWPGAKDTVGVYRPTLISLMAKVAEELGVKINPGTTFTQIENNPDGVFVTFTNGEQRSYDLVIGADGVQSSTRMALFPDSPQPAYTGQISVRWMAPGPRVDGESWFMSPAGRFGFYNLPDGPEGLVYVPSVFNMSEHCRLSEEKIHELFSGLLDSVTAPQVFELRSRLKSDANLIGRPYRWILVPDPWYRSRAILIGDAAHATTSHMGMGGGMALEDSAVLAQCIRDEETVEKAFQAFMRRRFDRVSLVVNTSLELSTLEQNESPRSARVTLLENAFRALSDPY